jgi:hypothetical protein
MTAFLCSFSLAASYTFVLDATGHTRMLFFGTGYAIEEILRAQAIEKTRPSVAPPDATHLLQLKGDDVENALKAYPIPLPNDTRRWLRNARITVTPDKSHPSGFYCGEHQGRLTWCYYSATIHLADGTDLIQSYEPAENRKVTSWRFSVYAHWPGAAGQELLWGW